MPGLTTPQREAVMHTEGPCRVVAGPGSGKTLVLTYRVARLIGEGFVHPDRCLIITFTKKAAEEMGQRVSKLLRRTEKLPWLGTIHSRFYRILMAEYGDTLSVLEDGEDKRWINSIQKRENLDFSRDMAERDIIAAIDAWRLSCKTPQDAEAEYARKLEDSHLGHLLKLPIRPMPHQVIDEVERNVTTMRQVLHIYACYQREKREKNAVDLTDMIYETWRLLSTSEGARSRWSKRFDFILVDEFQDIDLCQYEVVRMLASGTGNLFVVGDDDQAIYGFRGAKPEIMIDLGQHFPDLHTIVLTDNFRCPRNIVEAANKAISINGKRLPKTFVGAKDDVPPVFFSAPTTDDAAGFVVEKIVALRGEGVPLQQIAVIYRVHACSLPFEIRLMDEDIPYVVQKGGCFYDIAEVADLLAYFEIAIDRYTPETVMRVYAKPSRMGKRTDMQEWKKATGRVEDLGRSRAEYALPLLKLGNDLLSLQQICRGKPAGVVMETVLNYPFWTPNEPMTYAKWASKSRADGESGGAADADLQAATKTLLHAAAQFERPEEFMAHVSRTRAYAKAKQKSENAVRLSTFHGVKGLEFDHVFLTGMNEGCMPHKKSLTNPQQLQEERRLAHVGWTRTKKAVYVVSDLSEGQVSRFVLEWTGTTSTTSSSSTS